MVETDRLGARKPRLWMRSRIIQSIRSFFIERKYLEVETPYLIPAPAPELHIDAIPSGDLFLHTSPELCMKRLLASGFHRIFQLGKCFRQGERGASHLPEFTMLEWYRAGIDYRGLMEECEDLILFVSEDLGLGKSVTFKGREVDLQRPWMRLTVREAFERYASVTQEEAMASGRFDECMAFDIEPHLGVPGPVFLCDYPAPLAALSRLKSEDPSVAERFELYMGRGLELANAFSELTDSEEQRDRFFRESEKRRAMGKRTYPIADKFIEALPMMPESAGIALGVDRLVMFFADTSTIDDVVTFTPEEL